MIHNPKFYFLFWILRKIFFICFQLHVLSNIDLILGCVYVCCAAFARLSPSFYFCLHSSSFVCSTSSVPRQVFSIYVLGPVCLCFCPNVCAAWAHRACLRSYDGEREELEKRRRNNPANTNKHNSNSDRTYEDVRPNFPTRQKHKQKVRARKHWPFGILELFLLIHKSWVNNLCISNVAILSENTLKAHCKC